MELSVLVGVAVAVALVTLLVGDLAGGIARAPGRPETAVGALVVLLGVAALAAGAAAAVSYGS